MSDDMEKVPEPANLRFLRVLVTVLTAVMIGGVLLIATLLVQRLRVPAVATPDALILPEGAVPQAVTRGAGWWAVVTTDGRILLFDGGGSLTREIAVDLSASD